MTTKVADQEKVTKTDKPEDAVKSDKEKVRAGEDVIKYAETNKEEVSKKKKALPTNETNSTIIKGFDRLTGKEITTELEKITALSRYIYVHNLNDPTPVIEAVTYRAICPNTRHVSMDIDEATFEDLRQLPKFKNRVHYNYIDNMMKNDPAKGSFMHRTFHVNYPEWIKPEDVAQQAKDIVSHYGIPNLSGIEKVLWPDFTGKITKQSLSDVKEDDNAGEGTEDVQG